MGHQKVLEEPIRSMPTGFGPYLHPPDNFFLQMSHYQYNQLKKWSPEGEMTQRGKKRMKPSPLQVKRIAELGKMDAWQQLRLFQGGREGM